MKKSLDRRYFFKGCLSAASLVMSHPSVLAQTNQSIKRYDRVQLVDHHDNPITSDYLKEKSCYVFNYPFVSTPCFLINLGQSAAPVSLKTDSGDIYDWQGGSGPDHSIVAFSAICAHKLSYPTKSISFINYRPQQAISSDESREQSSSQQVIFCCSERSMYDPVQGAKVMSGPAPQPLTTIVLDHDAKTDNYYASGTLGGEMYDVFFERFGFNLSLENQLEDITQTVTDKSRIFNSTEYSKHIQSC